MRKPTTPTQDKLLAEVKSLAAKAHKAEEQAIFRTLSVVIMAYATNTQEALSRTMLPLLTDMQRAQQKMEMIKARRQAAEGKVLTE